MATLSSFLEDSVQRYASKPVLLFSENSQPCQWSYAELKQKVKELANYLRAQKINKGDRVIIWAANSPWWVATYFATLQLGAIVVPLDVRCNSDFAERVINQVEPKLGIISEQHLKNWDTKFPCYLIENLKNLPPTNETMPTCPAIDSDVALLMFTSGTTGDPKGVMLTHRNILANVDSANSFIPILPGYCLLSVLPLSHMLEQTVGLLQPIKQGASVFYPATLQPNELFRIIKEQHITTMVVVPLLLQLFMNSLEAEIKKQGKEKTWKLMLRLAHYLPMSARRVIFHQIHAKMGGRLQFFAAGGAYLDPELVQKWQLLGIRIVQGYGLTEAAPVVTGTIPNQDPASVGKPLPGVEVKISEEGEILVRGANITPGYWRNPQATEKAFVDGWLRTGDLGYLDKKGFLYLRGRKKDLIVLANGLNVYAEDVEHALKQTPGIIEAVVVAHPREPQPQVFAVIQCASDVTEPQILIKKANQKLAPYQQVKGFAVWSENDFPRTHTLKIKKNEVVRMLEENHPTKAVIPSTVSVKPDFNFEELVKLVIDIANSNLSSSKELTPEKTLEELGLDSLGRVELLVALEKQLDVCLDETQIQPDTSLGQLHDLVASGSNSTPIHKLATWPFSTPIKAVRPILQLPAFALASFFAPTKVCNQEIFDDLQSPILLIANHTSHFDTLVILKALPAEWRKQVAVAAAEDYFFTKKWLAVTVSLLVNAFPFSRKESVKSSLGHATQLITQSWSILLYPEGTRTPDGSIGVFKPGIGLLTAELGVPVLPIKIEGLYEVLPKGHKLPRRSKILVKFGRPLCFSQKESYQTIAQSLEEAVRLL